MDTNIKISLWNCLVKARQDAVKAENKMLDNDGNEFLVAHRKAQRDLGQWELSWFEFCQLD